MYKVYNPEAMLLLMQGGSVDPDLGIDADVDGSPFERLFGLRQQLVDQQREGEDVAETTRLIFETLASDFSELPEAEDQERAREIISGLFLNPREIEDLPGNVIEVVHDVCINVGMVRTLIYSYGVEVSEDILFPWMLRYRLYMVV